MFNWFRTFAVALTGLVALAGCASGSQETPIVAALQQPVTEYQLGIADKVRVTVFGEPTLTGEYTVGSAGTLSLPLIGEVAATGLTVTELQTGITTALAQGYLNNPRVSAEILSYRPFYILGEVEKPGEYPYTNNLTVLNAVATAEGFTYRANTRVVYIKRADSPAEQAYVLSTSTMVSPGDTVRIGERFF